MSDALLPLNPRTPRNRLWEFHLDHTDRVTKVPSWFSGSQRLQLAVETDGGLHWVYSEERPSMYSDTARAQIAVRVQPAPVPRPDAFRHGNRHVGREN